MEIRKVCITEDEKLIKAVFDGNDIEKENITVVDSYMGSGKTSWAAERMKGEGQYIYVAAYLEECQRMMDLIDGAKHFKEPNNKNKYGSKKHDLYNLILKGENIITTHSLFRNCAKDILDHIKSQNYTLILDEVMDVLEIKQISKSDYDMLIRTKSISIDKDGKVIWLNDNYAGSFDWVKEYSLAGQLYKHSSQDTDKAAFFVWQFPVEIFKYFKEVYILTYLFDGQIQKYYFDMHNIKYVYKQVECVEGEYKLGEYNKFTQYKQLMKFRDLINIYEGNLNDIGEDKYSFSVSFFERQKNKETVAQLKRNTENYMQHVVKGNSSLNMWTTFGDSKNKLKGRGYTKGFVAVNARSTNQYSHKRNLAYLANRFLPTYEYSYFKNLGFEIDQDLWALSELVQWIWRSAIRNGEPINIYIPSSRMRNLLIDWLDCKSKDTDSLVA